MKPKRKADRKMDAAIPVQGAAGMGTSDDALVRAARDGDFAAFEVLYERHRLAVYRFIYQMVHKQDEAEDITQEAFVRAFHSLHRFREQARFSTWITRIAMNLCTDRVRMAQRRAALEQKEAQGALEWMTMSGASPNPVEEIERSRTVALVRQAVMALPAHHRVAIILRDFEGKEYEEIGEVFGCSTGGAKLRVLRARRALKSKLAPLLGEQDSGQASEE
jgi:RNA polymerase sigma-70 factor (ECF subfamily)